MRARNSTAREQKREEGRRTVRRVPAGTFSPAATDPDPEVEPERPALVMVLAPLLGLAIWVAILILLIGRFF